jgi:hypothetical protein
VAETGGSKSFVPGILKAGNVGLPVEPGHCQPIAIR